MQRRLAEGIDAMASAVREMLFATDFSPASEEAGRVARAYACALGARLHLLHVAHASGDDPRAERLLARAAAAIELEQPVVKALGHGRPATAIVRYAGEHDIGLIVLGTHGRTGVSRMLLGSVAERVVRTAGCPVLTVSLGLHAQTPAVDAAGQPGACVVCGEPALDLMCEPCRTRVRGEAILHRSEEPG